MKILTNKPKELREGQTIFSFLQWLRTKGYPTNNQERMADTFHIPDEELNKLYETFLKEHKKL